MRLYLNPFIKQVTRESKHNLPIMGKTLQLDLMDRLLLELIVNRCNL